MHLSKAKFTLLVWRPPYKLRQYPMTKRKPFHPNIALCLTTNNSHSHARLQHAHLKIVVLIAVDTGLIVRVPAPQKVQGVTHAARLINLPWYVVVANALSLAPHDKPSSKYLQMQRLPLMSVTLLVRKRNKTPLVTVKLNDTPISMTVDTSASLDIIDEPTVDCLKLRVSLQWSTIRICAYDASTQLPILGKFAATLESNQTFHAATVHVVKG